MLLHVILAVDLDVSAGHLGTRTKTDRGLKGFGTERYDSALSGRGADRVGHRILAVLLNGSSKCYDIMFAVLFPDVLAGQEDLMERWFPSRQRTGLVNHQRVDTV